MTKLWGHSIKKCNFLNFQTQSSNPLQNFKFEQFSFPKCAICVMRLNEAKVKCHRLSLTSQCLAGRPRRQGLFPASLTVKAHAWYLPFSTFFNGQLLVLVIFCTDWRRKSELKPETLVWFSPHSSKEKQTAKGCVWIFFKYLLMSLP